MMSMTGVFGSLGVNTYTILRALTVVKTLYSYHMLVLTPVVYLSGE